MNQIKIYAFAYVGGMLASIPAFSMFNDVGASPFRNLNAVMNKVNVSIGSILLYYALLWLVPAIGSTLGAKIGGQPKDWRQIQWRGVGAQVIFSILFALLMMQFPQVNGFVMSAPIPMQTLYLLMFSQIGCSMGTAWGY